MVTRQVQGNSPEVFRQTEVGGVKIAMHCNAGKRVANRPPQEGEVAVCVGARRPRGVQAWGPALPNGSFEASTYF